MRADDQEYYYGPRPVALVELYTPTKLPVWPGKFAACNAVLTLRSLRSRVNPGP